MGVLFCSVLSHPVLLVIGVHETRCVEIPGWVCVDGSFWVWWGGIGWDTSPPRLGSLLLCVGVGARTR